MATVNYAALEDAYQNNVFDSFNYGTMERYACVVIRARQLQDIINDESVISHGYSLHDLVIMSKLSYAYVASLTCWLYRKGLIQRHKHVNELGKSYNLYFPCEAFELAYERSFR